MAQRGKIDWQAALSFWLEMDPPRTFVAVAQRFGCSDTAVRVRAQRDGWDVIAERIDREAARRLEARAVKTRTEATAEWRELIGEARSQTLAKLRAKTLSVTVAELAQLHRIEQLLDGQATDIIHISQAQTMVGLMVQLVLPMADELDELLGTNGARRESTLGALDQIAGQLRAAPTTTLEER